uniref:Uncharacterized protein n=1 Tax=Haptolina ericina TaxID=156174 RepID=A0A7S3EVP2_9EUKA
MAKRMNSYAEDTLMICKRVVREHGPDMLDALAVGDDTEVFCSEEAQLCELSHGKMLKLAKTVLEDEAAEADGKGRAKRKRRTMTKRPAPATKEEL